MNMYEYDMTIHLPLLSAFAFKLDLFFVSSESLFRWDIA